MAANLQQMFLLDTLNQASKWEMVRVYSELPDCVGESSHSPCWNVIEQDAASLPAQKKN